jgi:ribonuclease Z
MSATLKVIFLGTSASVPTSKRGLSAVALVREGEILLFDAGEGLQSNFIKANLGFNRKMKIFITHLHGDHCVGILGLLQTMSMVNREKSLSIYGPKGIIGFIKNNIRSLKFGLSFPLSINVVNEGIILEEKDYFIKTCRVKHKFFSYAYTLEEKIRPGIFHPDRARKLRVPLGSLWSKLQNGETIIVGGRRIYPKQVLGPDRPGRKVAISGDTRPSEKLKKFILNSDLAILDSTYFDDHEEKAKENKHMTGKEAAILASEANVKQLVLTHFSSRYDDLKPHLLKLTKIHPMFSAAKDLMVLEIPYAK